MQQSLVSRAPSAEGLIQFLSPMVRTFVISAGSVLFCCCAAAQTGPADFDVSAEERATVIDGAIEKLNAIYVFPDIAKKMDEAIRARVAKQEYVSLTKASEFARKLKADLREVSHDKHLGVMFFKDGAPETQPVTPTPEQLQSQRSFMEKLNFGFEKVERMQGNIGYIDIRGFPPAEVGGEAAAAAMTFVAHTDALIIDLRKNMGGEPSMIAYLQSYLFDTPTHLNDIVERAGNKTQQWWTLPFVPGARFGGKKPVFVLTSRQSFSGAEEFAYNLKNLKRATVIGETTGGGAHPSRPVKIANRFMLELPYARAVNPITGTNWEGTGVPPDVEVSAETALDAAYGSALEKVAATTADVRQKAQLERMIEERKTKNR
jgi:hypothetical protein